MDRLRLCLETLRRLAKETEDPSCVVLAEREINDYLQNEIDALRAALERLGRAIDEEARACSARADSEGFPGRSG